MKAATTAAITEKIEYELKRDFHPDGFPTLPEIPGGRYTDDDFFQLELTHLWEKSWLVAGRKEEIPQAGSYKLFERIGKAGWIIDKNRIQPVVKHRFSRKLPALFDL